ncbi:heterokaryon incompatibility [Fusarium sporotrichioides]|uniref:Heterokaryon incompatibility n=1 Tax=Fusarium sporotrichioides TaxID=5514 RepID=A0A395RZ14_FUSSP|nr:heterokaryon incompatibility [Fusarium sporotrichioides]
MSQLESIYHAQLSTNQIRLLQVNTDTSNPNAGFLKIVSLDDAPPFYAISHCWGTQAHNTVVRVSGQSLNITSDLAAGLKVLQELAINDSNFDPPLKYVWIDSICVNQQSISDRSTQVALMRQIYSTSVTTLVWLGPERPWVTPAWRLLNQIYHVFESDYPEARHENDMPSSTYSEPLHKLKGLPMWDDESWEHLRRVMHLDWFARIWVIQEVVLSPKDPVLICGSHLYPWHKFQWASSWLRRTGYMRLSQIPEKLLNVSIMGNIRLCRANWPLDALLSFTMTKFHATDQRDKIFGLLGIAAECQDPSRMPSALRPDYSADLTETYLKVARFLLENGSSLAILTRAHGTDGCSMRKHRVHSLPELPSWTPDWSDFRVFNKGIRTCLARVQFSDPETPPSLGFANSFTSSSGLELKLHNSEDLSILRVSVVRLATVTHCYYFGKNETSKEDFKYVIDKNLLAAWNMCLSVLSVTDLASWATRFIKATTAERYDLIDSSYEQTIRDGMAYLVRKLEVGEIGMNLTYGEGIREENIEILRQLSADGDAKAYATLAYTYCFSRCFMITSTGNIGIGPSDIQVGDSATVILGSNVPYVLRRNGALWSFIGESYIEGYMNGEVVRMMNECTIQEEVLEIR